MGKPNGEAGARKLQLLLVGGSEEDFASLRHRLTREDNGQLHLEHASSPDKALAQLGEKSYDLLLCSHKLTGDAALHLLRQMREHASVSSIVFLSDHVSQAVIATVMRDRASKKVHQGPGRAVTRSSPRDGHSAEHQRQKPGETLRKLWCTVEQSGELVIIADRSGTMEYVNPAFETVTGYSYEEAIGQPIEILRSEQQAEKLCQEIENTLLSGGVFRGTVIRRKKNGDNFMMETTITLLRSEEGDITHFICTGRDVSDQRRLQSELQQSQKMDAIGRLAGGVAHDFNNLLLVISGYAELMLDTLADEHPLRQNVTEIMTASRRAADLTRQLLAFGRKQMQSLHVLDLNSVIGEIAGMLPHLIGEDIELVFAPGENLGKIKADPIQIEQIMMNLAANARDAMPRGGRLIIETASVQLDETYVQRHSIVPPGNYVLLAVTDSGEGIAAEHLSHIFEPFYTTKAAGKGTGLGLATVYGIVKQNSGFVWVYSEPGLGTTFKIYLPRVPAVDGEVWVPKAEGEACGGCETLLLVEDEVAVRESTRQFLTRNGYTVLEASDGEDALHTSRQHLGPIHLMISDVVMPKLGGPKLAEQLASERPDMKVLFVSGYAESTVLQHGLIDITNRFLQKPFSLKGLTRKIREVLETKESLPLATTSRG